VDSPLATGRFIAISSGIYQSSRNVPRINLIFARASAPRYCPTGPPFFILCRRAPASRVRVRRSLRLAHHCGAPCGLRAWIGERNRDPPACWMLVCQRAGRTADRRCLGLLTLLEAKSAAAAHFVTNNNRLDYFLFFFWGFFFLRGWGFCLPLSRCPGGGNHTFGPSPEIFIGHLDPAASIRGQPGLSMDLVIVSFARAARGTFFMVRNFRVEDNRSAVEIGTPRSREFLLSRDRT